MSLLTTGVAVAVKATMGTLNVQNGDAGKGHTMSKQIYYCKPKTLIIN